MKSSNLAAVSLALIGVGMMFVVLGTSVYKDSEGVTSTMFMVLGVLLLFGAIGINIYGMAKRKKKQ